MIEKLGTCPNCGKSWDAGDVLANLCKMDVFHNKSQREMEKIAVTMGYSPENRSKFSKAIVHELEEGVVLECYKCMHIFDMKTEMEYEDMIAYKAGVVYTGPKQPSWEGDKEESKPTLINLLKSTGNGESKKQVKRSDFFYNPRKETRRRRRW